MVSGRLSDKNKKQSTKYDLRFTKYHSRLPIFDCLILDRTQAVLKLRQSLLTFFSEAFFLVESAVTVPEEGKWSIPNFRCSYGNGGQN